MSRITLASTVTLEGIGLHSGESSQVTLSPAPAGSGRIFVREGVEIPALADYVTDTRRSTTVGRNGVTVSTVEHLLAACVLEDIDDVRIDVAGPELPALDGAALTWVDAISAAGVCRRDGEQSSLTVQEPIWIADGDAMFFLCPAETFTVYAAVDIPDTQVIRQCAGGPVTRPEVKTQLARARTYALAAEVQSLLDAGLARGGSLENALVLTPEGYLNDRVWPQEPAWHKALDLCGDLALAGAYLRGSVLAVRAGHRSHVALVRQLRDLPCTS